MMKANGRFRELHSEGYPLERTIGICSPFMVQSVRMGWENLYRK